MGKCEVEKSKVMVLTDILDYIPNGVVIKNIINESTGSVTIISSDSGEDLNDKIVPFDKFIHLIEGHSKVIINRHSHNLEAGQSIIIPAHSKNIIKANPRFKMIVTIIKSGYE